jgi:hypothetical protein
LFISYGVIKCNLVCSIPQFISNSILFHPQKIAINFKSGVEEEEEEEEVTTFDLDVTSISCIYPLTAKASQDILHDLYTIQSSSNLTLKLKTELYVQDRHSLYIVILFKLDEKKLKTTGLNASKLKLDAICRLLRWSSDNWEEYKQITQFDLNILQKFKKLTDSTTSSVKNIYDLLSRLPVPDRF